MPSSDDPKDEDPKVTVTSFEFTPEQREVGLDALAKNAGFKLTRQEARESGRCVRCGEKAEPKIYSSAGQREYEASGLCEKCFDEIVAGSDDE